MATSSKNLSLSVPNTTDTFSTADIASNWNKIDAAPGVHICTAATRPSGWGANQAGRHIYETDTDLLWAWTGTKWSRSAPKGVLNRSDGSKALARRYTDFNTTSVTPAMILAVSNVVVPPGERPLMIQIVWSRAYATSGYFYGRCHLHTGVPASNSGTVLMQWAISGLKYASEDNQDGRGDSGTYTIFVPDGLAAGIYGFSFQIYMNGGLLGTGTVTGSANYPSQITVLEV